VANFIEKLDLAETVGRLYLQGQTATQIAKSLDAPRTQVVAALEDFKSLLRRESDSAIDIRNRLVDIMFEADESFRMVIDEAWKTAKEADAAGELKTKVTALKLVESSTKNRSDLVQRVGVGQDEDIIDQINETEEKQAVLIELLREIRNEYPEVAEVIATRLSQIQNHVEVVAIEYPDE
jgi:hypothetical protein